MLVTTLDNNLSQNYTHPDNQMTLLHVTHMLKPFAVCRGMNKSQIWKLTSDFKLSIRLTFCLLISCIIRKLVISKMEDERLFRGN